MAKTITFTCDNRERLPEEIGVKNDIFDNDNTFNGGLGYNQAPGSESTRVTLKNSSENMMLFNN